MTENNSILDKIIQSKHQEEASQFNPNEVVLNLFKNISTKERDVLNRRFGLLGKDEETLEQIGNYYKITRERIRQIEASTIRKLKDLEDFEQHIQSAEHNVTRLLQTYGGVMEQNHLLTELLRHAAEDPASRQASLFILSSLLDHKIERIKGDTHVQSGWKLPACPMDTIKKTITELTEIINKESKLLKTDQLMDLFQKTEFFNNFKTQLLQSTLTVTQADDEIKAIDAILKSYLTISRQINQNILGEWGLTHWNSVVPKRMGDKVYLVLRQAGRPLHFTEIADLINQAKFDKKIAYPATIHNELILDNRYVLVGRGIYALKEWGYQPGTVIDIVSKVIAEAGRPLTKDEIVELVGKQRLVRKSTIMLALTNKSKLKKLPDGRFTVAA